ncbi:MAG: rhamnosyltransferase, partial [Motiliproteus sp.]|nr:rhamnosyltransferase [Motiliproteus sp.]
SLIKEFQRYFDIGVFHARERWINQMLGGVGGEGLDYVVSELKYLGLKHIHLWPKSILSNFIKLLGYKTGMIEEFIPVGLKRKLSMHKGYWG